MARQPRADRYTAGQRDAALWRIIRAVVADTESLARHHESIGYDPGPSDRRLRELQAVRSLHYTLDRFVDSLIVDARRQEPALSWREIGEALGMTGQAIGQRARKRKLPIEPLTAEDFARFVAEGRALRGLPPLPEDNRPPPSIEKYDELLPSRGKTEPS